MPNELRNCSLAEFEDYLNKVHETSKLLTQRFYSGQIGKKEYDFSTSCLVSRASVDFPELLPRNSITNILEMDVKRYFEERNTSHQKEELF